jgi:hypothetical protein
MIQLGNLAPLLINKGLTFFDGSNKLIKNMIKKINQKMTESSLMSTYRDVLAGPVS